MINCIQVMRGVAALLVVFYHSALIMEKDKYFAQISFEKFFHFGDAGVDFFFVLSGFIIVYVHKAWIGDIRKAPVYILRRLIRLYPLYWVVFLFTLPLAYFVRGLPDIASVISSFFLIKHEMIVYVAWTLVYEMFFYCMFTILIINKRVGSWFFCIWLLMIVFNNYEIIFFQNWFYLSGSQYVSPYNLHFFLGMFAAIFVKRGWLEDSKIALSLGVIGTVCFMAVAVLDLNNDELYFNIFYGLSAVLMIVGYSIYELKNNILYNNVLLLLGASSYSIYLVHSQILSGIAKVSSYFGIVDYIHVFIAFLLSSFISIISGVLVYLYVEKRLLKIRTSLRFKEL